MALRRSLVWMYSIPSEDGKFVKCTICDRTLSYNGSTSAIMKHLRGKHRETFFTSPTEGFDMDSKDSSALELLPKNEEGCSRPLLQKMDLSYSSDRQEQISEALAHMIFLNMMPISFCSSEGFKQFMTILEPGYHCPSPESIMHRLQLLYNEKRMKIEEELSMASDIAITSDGWSSKSQDSYISMAAQFIDDKWIIKNYTLCTQPMEDHYTDENLTSMFNIIKEEWHLSGKVNSLVHDNAYNVSKATNSLIGVRYNISCAAHTLQLCVEDALNSVDNYKEVIQKGSKIVQYFRHSNVATSSLTEKQKHLNLGEQELIQTCPMRWSSSYYMCEQLVCKKNAIVSVLADRNITKLNIALKLEMSEQQWSTMSDIIVALKPLQVAITALCFERSVTISLVCPVIHGLINNHLESNDFETAETKHFKNILKTSLINRFNLNSHFETVHRIASFLDPRSKELSFESNEVKNIIKTSIRDMMENISIPDIKNFQNVDPFSSALDFIFQAVNPSSGSNSEFQTYLLETQINHNLCPLVWWKMHENKYPRLAKLAKMYLSIPATSISSEHAISTAGNIVSSNCSYLLPENIDLMVFLHRNKDV
ncbi:E3 SUMO-protein ligase ZBED1-like [Osmia lignaria lignaria]|uniref:E3 SUMO-protein ligase ZBED1-like n=1 Tax=Osmia lignaria lignaria TaxID=1437193 RepID=UPI0014791800|nr:zinc finger BED domain-containing protein 1-like [Osmia lignaria]